MDGIKAESVVDPALHGWAITRIPPTTAPLYWYSSRGPVSLISVSNVVLQEDFVDCARMTSGEDWLSALKL